MSLEQKPYIFYSPQDETSNPDYLPKQGKDTDPPSTPFPDLRDNSPTSFNREGTTLSELTRAAIPLVRLPYPMTIPDVTPMIVGILSLQNKPAFVFHRERDAWVARGGVTLEAARDLYDHPQGKIGLRPFGFPQHTPPDELPYVSVQYFDADGKRLRQPWQKPDDLRLAEQEGYTMIGETPEGIARKYQHLRFVEDPAKEAIRGTIGRYTISTQEGLNLFVATLKRHKLVSSPRG